MDLQDNQPVQNRQDSQPPNLVSNSSSSSSSQMEEDIKPNGQNIEPQPDSPQAEVKIGLSIQELPENVSKPLLPAARSEPALEQRQQKSKRRKVRAYVQDFTEYIPESLLAVNKTVIPAIVKKGERYQADIASSPPLKSSYKPMEQWLVWNGSTNPQQQPTEDHLLRFKQLLGDNRTEQQFIHIRQKMGMSSWKEVLQYIGKSKGELRRVFHMTQRNRL